MSHQIWHAFYFDKSDNAAPCRSEVIEAVDEEQAARVAQSHLGGCQRATLEAAPWMKRINRVIYAEGGVRRRGYLH